METIQKTAPVDPDSVEVSAGFKHENIEGYIFDRKAGKSLEDSMVRLYPATSNEKRSIRYAEIARLEFGKDRAAGKHWEHWVAQYQKKKAAGEKNIGLQPDALD